MALNEDRMTKLFWLMIVLNLLWIATLITAAILTMKKHLL